MLRKDEDWPAIIEAMNTTDLVEVDEETFEYFLGVLPPVFMKGRKFGFAEGCENITVFEAHADGKFTMQGTLTINPNG